MGWFFKVIRIAGASFPGASSLVQLQAEIDSIEMTNRIDKLSDPISYLHEDVQKVSKNIYQALTLKDSVTLEFDDHFYNEFSRPLAALESQGLVIGNHAIGKRYARGISLVDPSFIMYMCAIAEDDDKMEKLNDAVDSCGIGKSLDGYSLQNEIKLPLQVVRAMFSIYESKGYGLVSKEIGSAYYLGKA